MKKPDFKYYIVGIVIVLGIIFFLNSGQQADQELNSYVACGCGCCGGMEPIKECLYHSEGDDINEIIKEDKSVADSEICSVTGCTIPINYSYCD